MTVLRNCRIFDGERIMDQAGFLTIHDGIIDMSDHIRKSEDSVDCGGGLVVPGYVDIHTHGIEGYDNSDLTSDEFKKMANAYAKTGTTTFFPTFPAISSKTAAKSLEVYKEHEDEIPGIHLEGPFINKKKKGAQNPDFIRKPDLEEYSRFVNEYMKLIKRVTLSPERDAGFELSKYLLSKGIKVSFGHTTCNYETGMDFLSLSGIIATHLFNAMPPIHHRKPAITTAALMDDDTYCEVIPDLIHLHPEILRMVFRLKGPEKVICVSDSIFATGLKPGKYIFSGLEIKVEKGSARLESGNLAGSIITMAEGVRNLINIGISPVDALTSATSTPAKAMGIESSCGFIRNGMPADILILGDDYFPVIVYKAGKRII